MKEHKPTHKWRDRRGAALRQPKRLSDYMKATKQSRSGGSSRTTCSTSLGVYPSYPDDEIIRCIDELRKGIPEWFAANQSRKICKVDLFYGRSIDVRRENWEARLNTEQAKLISESNVELTRGADQNQSKGNQT